MPIDIEAPGANEAALIAAIEALVDGEFAPLVHTHDDRYYTESEVNALLAARVWAPVGTGNTATGVWDQAVDGSAATVSFLNLTGTELMISCRLNTLANSGRVWFHVSTNNGSSYFTSSGNYVSLSTAGVEANLTAITTLDTNHTAARTGTTFVHGINLSVGAKIVEMQRTDLQRALFVGSSDPINAIQFSGSAGGNITAGTIRMWAR